MRRVETNETYVEEIPLELFQGDTFKRQLYLNRAAEIVSRGIEALRISKEEPILICTGYILSKALRELREKEFHVTPVRIRGETQALAEGEFIRSLEQMGVGDEAAISRMRSFKGLLKWVMEDLQSREHFVKTGWESWPKFKREGIKA